MKTLEQREARSIISKRYYQNHLEERRAKNRLYRQNNKEKTSAYRKRYNLKNKKKNIHYRLQRFYGITSEQYDLLYEKQKGRCAICKIHQSKLPTALCVDHDHKTGKIRGLLCRKCNIFIGMANDNLTIFKNAIHYLNKKL